MKRPVKAAESNGPHIEMWALDRVKPYEKNPRAIPDAAIDKVASSIKEFGFQKPIVVDEQGVIIAGHVMHRAAQKAGLSQVPVAISGLSPAQTKAYRLADNRTAQETDWIDDLLKNELDELKALDFDLDLIGFDDEELSRILEDQTEGLTDPDETPEPPVNPVSQLGDVWVLGRHRIICGDSTSTDAITKLMQGERADLLFTSPPYAQQRDYGAAKEKVSDWDALMQGVFSIAPVKTGAQVLVNLGLVHREGEWLPYWDGWISWMRDAGWRRFGWYVWDQGPGLPGDWNGRLAPSHEFIFHFNRDPRKPNKTVPSKHAGETLGGGGLRAADGTVKRKTGHGNAIQSHKIPDSVFRVMRHKGGLGKAGKHPAVFPVALVEQALTAYSKEGDVVFEPFCGSGTQIIASEKTARHCFGVELDPAYVDVAVKRWQDFTGQKATLDGDGRTFEEIDAVRYAKTGAPDNSAKSYDAAIAELRKQHEANAA